jgi:hypothetical protein
MEVNHAPRDLVHQILSNCTAQGYIYGRDQVIDLFSLQDAILQVQEDGYHGWAARAGDVVQSSRKIALWKSDILIPARGPVSGVPAQVRANPHPARPTDSSQGNSGTGRKSHRLTNCQDQMAEFFEIPQGGPCETNRCAAPRGLPPRLNGPFGGRTQDDDSSFQ